MGEDDPFVCKGWLPDPVAEWPDAAAQKDMRCQRWDDTDQAWHDLGPYDPVEFKDDVFLDGSAFPAPFRRMWRAGWAAVQMTDDKPVLRIFGPVVEGLAQTAPSAEWQAMTTAMIYICGHCRIFSDCLAVVRGMGKTFL